LPAAVAQVPFDQPCTGASFTGTQYENGWFDAAPLIMTVSCRLSPGIRLTF
jgi:hypothetical protein